MPADGYTPTTEQVRRAYTTGMRHAFIASAGEHSDEFDRFLAAHDARVRADAGAQALRDAAEAIDGARPRHLGDFGLDPLDYSTGGEYGIDCVAEFLIARADTITQEDTP